jgi:AcrR family transcriptional regulator
MGSREELGASRRADAVANRGAIVRAAGVLYAQRGVDVPFEEIAEAAGVGRATVYRHFETREDLHVALLARIVEDIEAAAAALPDRATSFMRLFKRALQIQTVNMPLVELLPARQLRTADLDALRARLRAAFKPALASAQAAELARPEITTEDVRLQLAMLSGVIRPDTRPAEQSRALRLAQWALTGR